jgi:hypothetical protein
MSLLFFYSRKNFYLISRVFFLFFFLIFRVTLFSQNTTDSITVVQELDPDYQEEEVKTDQDNEVDYFLKKEEQQADWKETPRRKLADSTIRMMKEDEDFWYANAIFETKKKKEDRNKGYIPIGERTWFKTLIWLIIVGGFATILIFYLASSNVGLFRKKNVSTAKVDQEEEMPEDIFAINYQKEIEKATLQGNYRLAVRLMFLKLLKIMSEKNVISYKQDKTNFDYLIQLHPTGYYKDFFRITRNYEFSWYGKFEVSEEAFGIIRREVKQFENQLK